MFSDNNSAAALVAAFAAGAVFPFSLAPFDFWPLAFVSLVGFLFLVDGRNVKTTLLLFYAYFLGMFAIGVSWIYVSINVYGGASPLLAGLLITLFVMWWSLTALPHAYLYARFVSRWRFGLVLGFPALWVFSEWFRTWLLTGFPWLFVGYSQIETPLVGYAPLSGVYAVSFMTVITGTLIYEILRRRKFINGLWIALIWLGGFLAWQVPFVEPTRTIKVAAVQGNIDQHTKWQRDMVMPILRQYEELTETVWDAEIIVWPEAAITLFRENAQFALSRIEKRARKYNSTVVLGIPDRNEAGRFLNTAVSIGDGAGSYHKRRLVPFGEYVPLEDYLRGLIGFFDLPMSRNQAGAMAQAPLTAGELELAMSICYEIVYPELVRTAAPAPDLLVTISNDTWFGDSMGPEQHLQMALMRAIENGRPMIRATNNGITVLANHRGEVVGGMPRNRSGSLFGELTLVEGSTPYRHWGQLPILIFAGLLLAVLGIREAFM